MGDREVSKGTLYGIMAGMLLTGTANTVVLKIMDVAKADYTDPVTKKLVKDGDFNHPFFQTALMFLGELCVLFAYFISEAVKKRKAISDPASPGTIAAERTNLKTKINPFWLAIPGSCDFFGSTTMFFSLLMVDASVYQMLRGSIVIITAGFAMCFLKKKQYRHHFTSLFVIFMGLLLVGVSSVLSSDSSKKPQHDATTTIIGIVLLLIAQVFAGTQFVVEEKILGNYYLNPMVVVGWEGFFGFTYYLIALPILQFISCTPDKDTGFCTYHTLENSIIAFN